MKKIVLITCASKKQNKKLKAKEIYVSPLFKFNLAYAKKLNPDQIFILSAKYGLLDLEKEIEPYNETLNNKTEKEIKSWSENVLNQMRKKIDIRNDEIIFLAGEKYRKYLIPHLKNYSIPLKGLGIGKQLSYLKKEISK